MDCSWMANGWPARTRCHRSATSPAPSRTLPLLALVGATFIWGSSSVATKLALVEVPPISLAFGRIGVAYLVLLVLVRGRGGRPACGRVPALLGLIGVAGFVLLRNVGLRSAPAGDASLFEGGAAPALSMALAFVLLGERPSRRRFAGLIGAFAGAALAVLPERAEAGGAALLGDGLLFAAAVCFAANTVLGRLGYADRDHLSATAYALWGYGLSQLEAGQVAIAGNLMFVFGLAAAMLFLGEAPTPGRLLGAALVLGGVWLAAFDSGRLAQARAIPLHRRGDRRYERRAHRRSTGSFTTSGHAVPRPSPSA